jgi:hypothetical protein
MSKSPDFLKQGTSAQSGGTCLIMGAHPCISSSEKSAPVRKTRILETPRAEKDPKREAYFIVSAAISIGGRVCGTLSA